MYPVRRRSHRCVGYPLLRNSIYYWYTHHRVLSVLQVVNVNPCQPSPCGPYSQCRVSQQHAVCSCSPTYVGAPPSCRPECVVSTDCAQDKACVNQRCIDPCPGTCGQNTRCVVVGHNPICSCQLNFVGDPFVSCQREERKRTRMKRECSVLVLTLFPLLSHHNIT